MSDNEDGPAIFIEEQARRILEDFLRDPMASGLRKDADAAQQRLKSKGITMTKAKIKKLLSEYTELQTKGFSFAGKWPRMYPSAIWFADLLDTKYKQPAYLFTMIDLYSRYAIVYPISSKATTKTAQRLEETLEFLQSNNIPKPRSLITDDGKEFKGSFLKACREHGIPLNQVNASRHHGALTIIDRFHRTLRELFRRYEDIYGGGMLLKNMDEIVKGYNHRYHRGIKAKPAEAIMEHPKAIEHDAWPDADVSVGDYVRLKVPISMYEKASAILRLEPEVYRVIRRVNEKLYLMLAEPSAAADAEPFAISLFSVAKVHGYRKLKDTLPPMEPLPEPELKDKIAEKAQREMESDFVPEFLEPKTSKRDRAARRDYAAMARGSGLRTGYERI